MSTSSQNQMLALDSHGIDRSQLVQAQRMPRVYQTACWSWYASAHNVPHRFLLASQQQGMSTKGLCIASKNRLL